MPNDTKLPPPGADSKKAQKYVDSLAKLIEQEKVTVTQTDLSRFNSSSMEDHYRINLEEYDVELSHNRNQETREETFIMIFNSVNRVDPSNPKPVILAYVHLTAEQFLSLKQTADNLLEKIRRIEEEKRFNEAMQPIDQLLTNISSGNSTSAQDPSPETPEPVRATETTPADITNSEENKIEENPVSY